jgi:hypothetical protein
MTAIFDIPPLRAAFETDGKRPIGISPRRRVWQLSPVLTSREKSNSDTFVLFDTGVTVIQLTETKQPKIAINLFIVLILRDF